MQTFLPYADFANSFKVLDYKRLGKQRAEALTLIHVIESIMKGGEKPKGWVHHPITIMWRPYCNALKLYCNLCIKEWISRGYSNTIEFFSVKEKDVIMPDWLGFEPFHASHRANLLRKDYSYYSKFHWKENPIKPYLWRDENKTWYYFDSKTKTRHYLTIFS
ncbi:MAG: MSMEG_6728 family protein [Candidatus Lokiarchaeota archaeon]|nr:MSMEG_6728 family protein [Candidatus Lokiarchaeota archaeon]